MEENLKKPITKRDLKNYFKLPSFLWFKNNDEIEETWDVLKKQFNVDLNFSNILEDDENDDEYEKLFNALFDFEDVSEIVNLSEKVFEEENWKENNLIKNIINLIDSDELEIVKTQFLVYKKVHDLLKKYIQKIFFEIHENSFYDHSIFSKSSLDSHNKSLKLLKKNDNFIIYQPKIFFENFCLDPTFIIKSKGKIYIIEFKISSTQKRENILDFIFYENILKKSGYFEANCYLNCLIQKVAIHDLKDPASFILTSFFPVQGAPSINSNAIKYIKTSISQEIEPIDKLNDLNVLWDSRMPCFDFIKSEYKTEEINEILEKFSYIRASRPIYFYQDYLEHKKDEGLIERTFITKQDKININSFLNKKLKIEDYPFEILFEEDREKYDLHNNKNYFEYLKSDQLIQFAMDHDLTNSKNEFKKDKLLIIKIISNLIYPKFSYIFDAIDGTERNKKLFLNFFDFFQNESKKMQNQKIKINFDFFTKNYFSENPFKDNKIWKKFLSIVYPNYLISGYVASVSSLYNIINNEENKNFKNINEKIKKIFLGDEIFKKNGIDENCLINDLAVNIFKKYLSIPNKIYYDFESLCLPIGFMKNTQPYQQIVNQISIIKKLKNDENLKSVNVVYDPKKMNIQNFKEIIDLIHLEKNKENVYVVYNKSFENSRLKEMSFLINDPIYYKKVREIINNTFDLADVFDWRKKMLIFKSLKGFHSIKKVIEIVSENNLLKAGALSYKKLVKVQNGAICQGLAISRLMEKNATEKDNLNWNNNVDLMKKYCENDVRSMIGIEYLVNDLIEKASNEFKTCSNEKILEIIREWKSKS